MYVLPIYDEERHRVTGYCEVTEDVYRAYWQEVEHARWLEKQARSREMNALAEQVRCEVLAAHEGTEDDVLLETPLSGTLFTGYTRLYIPVVVSAPGHKSGEIVHVRLGPYDGERVRATLC